MSQGIRATGRNMATQADLDRLMAKYHSSSAADKPAVAQEIHNLGLPGYSIRGDQKFDGGGITSLDPHYLKGPGDGMSDSIPAYIDGGGAKAPEPIKVADSEY